MGDGSDFDIEAFLLQEALMADDAASNLAPTPATSSLNFTPPHFYSLIWPSNKPIVPGWLNQSLSFSPNQTERIGILQPINGPCGILASIQAILIQHKLTATGRCKYSEPFSDRELANALKTIITNCLSYKSTSCTLVLTVG